jgi:epoxyqueuosine reductase
VSPDNDIPGITRTIRQKALELGFADCGFASAGPLHEDAGRLQQWLADGLHAGMHYMENHFKKRTDPTKLVEGSVSVISLLYNYYTDDRQEDPSAPVISTYAYGKDYHRVVKDKMQHLLGFIRSLNPETRGRVFVDSAPVLDRAWARKAGLGWIGKNSNLISRKYGSFVFIGEIFLNIPLEYNQVPESDFCGSCTRCIDACPTGAILGNRTLDAAKCISYQTIEHKGAIRPDVKENLQERFFGCDICQEVCPWNRKAIRHNEPDFEPAPELMKMTRDDWMDLQPDTFRLLFTESAVQRAGYEKLMDTISCLEKSGKNKT